MNVQRRTMTEAFRAVCEVYRPWTLLPLEQRAQIIRRMERNCFEIAIDECRKAGINRLFDEPRFLARYSSVCYKLLSNLDVNGSVSSTYLLDKLIDGSVDPYVVAEFSSERLCPEASAAERDMIAKQQSQTAILKVSRAYVCPKCGGDKTLPREYQGRAADEGGSLSIKCTNCNWIWRR
jgi:DNA-directed RNA polymerase subunit M/transcription elongation factor TFIIS